MKTDRRPIRMLAMFAVMFCVFAAGQFAVRPAEAASEVKIVVNGDPITSYDISARIKFLRLQHKKGNLPEMAKKGLIDQTLKRQAIARTHTSVSTDEVDAAFARFAKANHMSTSQMSSVLDRSGVGVSHFKSYMAVQMSWPRLVAGQGGSGSKSQDLVSEMMKNGGKKPSTTEYVLQQVIFLVPKDKRGAMLGQRKREANAMRSRFAACDKTRDFAAKLRNVAVRDLGRIMEPQLPPEWKSDIENTSQGKATPVHVTDRGAEFIGICSARTVSDDLAAELVLNSKEGASSDNGDNAESEKLLDNLRKHATITYK